MTTFAPNATTVPGRWMTRAELAQAAGLREDLVARFVPATDTPTGPMYTANQVALAVYVKELTDNNMPPAAVDERVREFLARPGAGALPVVAKPVRRRGLWTAVGGGAAAALIVGGVIGGMIGYNNGGGGQTSSTPVTVTAAAPAPQFNPTIPAAPDPVCAEWAPLAESYGAKQTDWANNGGDPNLAASAWTADQRALNMGIVPILVAQAQDMERLAGKASDPFLAGLLRAQAVYEQAFASQLPNYQPGDRSLWSATVDLSGAVRAACTTVAPR